MCGPVERMTLTHLQIPFKESCRGVGDEAADQGRDPGNGRDQRRSGTRRMLPEHRGVGEGRKPAEECWVDLADRIAPRLLGRSFDTVEELNDLAATWTDKAKSAAIAGRKPPAGTSSLRRGHAPLAEMLGASRDQLGLKVESGLAVGLYPTVVELLKAIETHLAEGYRRIKIEIEPGRDVELVHAVRQHFGDLPLMVDARGAYTIADLNVFRELDLFDLLMIEQPMAADDLAGSAALQAELVTPICLDESSPLPRHDRRGDSKGACRIVSLKIGNAWGTRPCPRDP